MTNTPTPARPDKCFWVTGCSDSERCCNFGSCIAWHQREHKFKFAAQPDKAGEVATKDRIQQDIDESRALVNAAITAVREADETFEKVGGGTKHWFRDCFLPALAKQGLGIFKNSYPSELERELASIQSAFSLLADEEEAETKARVSAEEERDTLRTQLAQAQDGLIARAYQREVVELKEKLAQAQNEAQRLRELHYGALSGILKSPTSAEGEG